MKTYILLPLAWLCSALTASAQKDSLYVPIPPPEFKTARDSGMLEGVVIHATVPRRPLVNLVHSRPQVSLNRLRPDVYAVHTQRFGYNAGDAAAFYSYISPISRGMGMVRPAIYGLHGSRLAYQVHGIRVNPMAELWAPGLAWPLASVDELSANSPDDGSTFGAGSNAGGILMKDDESDSGKTTLDVTATARSASRGYGGSADYKGGRKRAMWRLMTGAESHADYRDGDGARVPNSRWRGAFAKARSGFRRGRWQQDQFVQVNTYGFGYPDSAAAESARRSPEAPSAGVADWLAGSSSRITFGPRSSLDIQAGAHYRQLQIQPDRDSAMVFTSSLTFSENIAYQLEWKSRWTLSLSQNGYLQNTTPMRPLTPWARFQTLGLATTAKLVFDNRPWSGGADLTGTFQRHRATDDSRAGSIRSQSVSRWMPTGRAWVAYWFSETWLVLLYSSAGARLPGDYERFANGWNPAARRYEQALPGAAAPEQTWSTYLDWKHFSRPGRNLALDYDLSGFYNRVHRFVLPDSTGVAAGFPAYTYVNPDARLHGYDLAVALRFENPPGPFFDISLRQSYTCLQGRRIGGPALPLIQAPVWNSVLQFGLSKTKWYDGGYLQLEAVHAFAQRRPAPQETATPAYTLLNFFGEIRLYPERKKSYTLVSIAVRNLLNANYVDHLSLLKPQSLPNPGRDVMLSIRYHGVW